MDIAVYRHALRISHRSVNYGRHIYTFLTDMMIVANMAIVTIAVMVVDMMLMAPEMRTVSMMVMVLVMMFLIMLLMMAMPVSMPAAMAIVVGQCGQGQSQQSG